MPSRRDDMETRIRAALAQQYDRQTAQATRLDYWGGHASLRLYWRIHLPPGGSYPRGERSAMTMVMPLPDDPAASPFAGGELPFVNVQRYLDKLGLPVPAIDFVSASLGVLVEEDLGDETLEIAALAAPDADALAALYRQAVALLVDFQAGVLRDPSAPEESRCVGFDRRFDRELLRWELEHYLEWGLQARCPAEALVPFRDGLADAFDRIVDALLALPYALALRDYQSRNLMRKNGEWHIIDFQDALRAPCVYDLVALLRDSYVVLPEAVLDVLLDEYVARGRTHGLPWCSDGDALRRAFHLQTIQRKLKDAGRFVYLDRVKGNADFLQYYDTSVGYARTALHRLDGWEELGEALDVLEADSLYA